MKTLQLAIAFLLSLAAIPISAQNETDVLRFSQNFNGGTARFIGLGGAFGALGGDMTSLSLNPAGIGVYRVSEFTFTPTVNIDNTKSTFLGTSFTDSKYKFNLNNIGYVYTYNTNKDEGWVSASFGIAYNRLNDFNKNATIMSPSSAKGGNPYSSLLDGFTWNLSGEKSDVNLNNIPYYEYYEALAQNTNAVWFDQDSGRFINYFETAHQHNQLQERTISTKGGIGEYAFSFGANYSHKLYLGLTIGVDQLNYEEVKSHTESQTPSANLIDNFNFTDNFKTWGTGYNFKLGLIYKPIDLLRLGLALHTPTFYNLSSEFYTSMEVNYKLPPFTTGTKTNYFDQTQVSTFDYNITTPMRFIGSLALQFQQYGVLSFDYEYMDYTKGKIRADSDPFTDVNNIVQNSYKSASNLRVGAEGKIGDFALRAGFGYYESPYNTNQLNKNASTTSYSVGFGYRGKSFFFDAGYIMFNTKYVHKLYDYYEANGTFSETADLNSQSGRVAMTFGFRF